MNLTNLWIQVSENGLLRLVIKLKKKSKTTRIKRFSLLLAADEKEEEKSLKNMTRCFSCFLSLLIVLKPIILRLNITEGGCHTSRSGFRTTGCVFNNRTCSRQNSQTNRQRSKPFPVYLTEYGSPSQTDQTKTTDNEDDGLDRVKYAYGLALSSLHNRATRSRGSRCKSKSISGRSQHQDKRHGCQCEHGWSAHGDPPFDPSPSLVSSVGVRARKRGAGGAFRGTRWQGASPAIIA